MTVTTCKQYLMSFVVGVMATMLVKEVMNLLLALVPPLGFSFTMIVIGVAFTLLFFVVCSSIAAIITACIRQPVKALLSSWSREKWGATCDFVAVLMFVGMAASVVVNAGDGYFELHVWHFLIAMVSIVLFSISEDGEVPVLGTWSRDN